MCDVKLGFLSSLFSGRTYIIKFMINCTFRLTIYSIVVFIAWMLSYSATRWESGTDLFR